MKTKDGLFKQYYGPRAIVAGASEGLGSAFARSLAARGVNLLLLARREELLQELKRNLELEFSISVQIMKIDLADMNEVESLITNLREDYGLLVYNAAYAPISRFSELDRQSLLNVTQVNVQAPLLMTKSLTDKMRIRKKGGIILMSSLSGFQGGPGLSAYSASKAFNTVLAEGLWAEFHKEGIDVMACCAGAVRTPGYLAASKSKEAPGTLNPEDVAEQTLRALGKGPIFIPGRLNRLFHFVMGKLISRKRAVKIMEANTKDLI